MGTAVVKWLDSFSVLEIQQSTQSAARKKTNKQKSDKLGQNLLNIMVERLNTSSVILALPL